MAKDDDENKLNPLIPTRGGEENDAADDGGDEEDDEDAPSKRKTAPAANGKDADDDDSSGGDLVDYALSPELAKQLGLDAEPKPGADKTPAGAEENPDDTPQNRRLSKGQKDRQRRREAEARAERLERELEEVKRTVGTHAQRLSEQQIADLDRGIGDLDGRIADAKRKRAEAREAQNWDASDQANDELRKLERDKEKLEERREAAKKTPAAPAGGNESDAPRVDGRIQRQFQIWHGRNPGFDPKLRDPQSRAAIALERDLAEERNDHDSPEYWRELDKRCKENGINLSMDGDQDAGGGRRARRQDPDPARTTPRPTAVGSGNGSVPRPGQPKLRIPRELAEQLENGDYTDQARDRIIKNYFDGVKKGGKYATA